MDIFVSRQPLFDRQRHVVAYDLHYRTGRLQAVGGNPDEIARKMVNNTMLGFGLDTEALAGGAGIFRPATRMLRCLAARSAIWATAARLKWSVSAA